MRTIAELEDYMESPDSALNPTEQVAVFLQIGEEILEHWVIAHGGVPTQDKKEGFRVLALQRQGSKGDASFNACRETARELAYHYNLVTLEPEHKDVLARLTMAQMVAKHLVLFVGGKLQVSGLGEFCCSSKGLRLNKNEMESIAGENHG